MKRRRRPDKPNPHDIETEGLPSSSGFDAEFRCPGKRALCKRLPKEEDTVVTERGHRIHEAMEKGDFSELNETDARTASRIAYGESEIVHEYSFEGAQVTFEERAWDYDAEFNHTWSGRIDRYDWMPEQRRLLVLDDKTGWTTPPPIHDNWQLRSEGALKSFELGALETVVGLIHPHHPDSLWEAKIYSADEMLHQLDIVRHNVAKIQLPDQPRIPGPIQCQWCQAKNVCPEYQADGAKLDQAVQDEIEDGGFSAINRRSPEERGQHVRWLKQRERDFRYVLDQYVALLERDPDAIDGWRLARKVDRSVTDEVKAMEAVRLEYGPDVLYACLKFSIKELEDQLAKDSSRKEAKRKVEAVLGPLLRYKKSKSFLDEARSL